MDLLQRAHVVLCESLSVINRPSLISRVTPLLNVGPFYEVFSLNVGIAY